MGRPHFASRDMEHDYGRAAHHRSNSGPNVTFAFLLSTSCLFLAHGVFAMTPVILSSGAGNGIDDQWVVVYALTNPQVGVLGVVSARSTCRFLVGVVENRLHMQSHPLVVRGRKFTP